MPERVHAMTTIEASAEEVFAVLADPTRHRAIDGTGWVQDAEDVQPLSWGGQIFRMGMFHADHPDGHYEICNEVTAFDPPTAVAWKPGYIAADGELTFGGWIWRYDVTECTAGVDVRLTYDWSQAGPEARAILDFPPFPPDHLSNSLAHLVELVRDAR